MSSPRQQALARRQAELLAGSDALRGQLAHDLQAWMPAVERIGAAVGIVRGAWHWLRAHPEAPIVASLVIVAARPRGVMRWGLRLWSAWRLWRQLMPPR